jgi:predicted double-glycine peptidase
MQRICSLILVLFAYSVSAHASDIVLQSTPTDCGPAALATLLDKYLAVPATEAEMVTLTEANPDYGTTLLGLEKAATHKGCESDSFRMTWETLKKQVASYPMPLIVRTLNPEPHFSVLLGIDKGTVFLADPAIGHIMLSERAFLKRWILPTLKEGYVFIAAGPDGSINQERRSRILKDLAVQYRNLQTIRPQLPAFRR